VIGTLLPTFGPSGRRSVAKWLARHHVTVLDDRVTEVRPDAVVLASGTVLPSALTVWTGGFAVPALAQDSGLRTDDLGRLLTDETLTSVDDDRIVAAGDAGAPSGMPLRMSCYAAGPLGAQAADTVLSRIAGTEPEPISLAFSGACVSLGRRSGVRQLARTDDKAVNVHLGGRVGAAIKELTCKLGVVKIRREASNPGSLVWPKGTKRRAEVLSS
jgi:NADH dehydrogenase